MSERNRARRSRRQPHNVITGQNVHINSFYKASNFCNTKVDKLVVKKLSLFGGSGSDKVKPGKFANKLSGKENLLNSKC